MGGIGSHHHPAIVCINLFATYEADPLLGGLPFAGDRLLRLVFALTGGASQTLVLVPEQPHHFHRLLLNPIDR